jgi:hypothetical protein
VVSYCLHEKRSTLTAIRQEPEVGAFVRPQDGSPSAAAQDDHALHRCMFSPYSHCDRDVAMRGCIVAGSYSWILCSVNGVRVDWKMDRQTTERTYSSIKVLKIWHTSPMSNKSMT